MIILCGVKINYFLEKTKIYLINKPQNLIISAGKVVIK